jgi:hypothetical protein
VVEVDGLQVEADFLEEEEVLVGAEAAGAGNSTKRNLFYGLAVGAFNLQLIFGLLLTNQAIGQKINHINFK